MMIVLKLSVYVAYTENGCFDSLQHKQRLQFVLMLEQSWRERSKEKCPSVLHIKGIRLYTNWAPISTRYVLLARQLSTRMSRLAIIISY